MHTSEADGRRSRTRLIAAFRDASLDAESGLLLHRVVELAACTVAELRIHFAGVDELAVAALVEEFDTGSTIYFTARVENRLTGTQLSEQAMAYVLGFIGERRPVYRQILTGGSRSAVAAEEALAERAREYLRAQRESAHPEVASRMFAAGVMAIIRWWLADDAPMSTEDLAREISRAVPPDFTH
ncbi:TetR family transcriptional regulator C-terminal domain-containing protein [Aeromicrobium fastidiosum]|nr:TetR family transcriptional regulator C-terminal domain-containing protein [Aeromicrobium fastidiosum]